MVEYGDCRKTRSKVCGQLLPTKITRTVYQMSNKEATTKVIHNPKSESPALYIPCWLSQVSTKLISDGAKILYGRLAQWSNSKGDVYRSAPQLAKEVGVSYRTIENRIKELKTLGLIGTYQPKKGGMSSYVFYKHPWMDDKLHAGFNLDNPPPNLVVPTTKNGGTPPPNLVVISKISKKKVKKDITPLPPETKKQELAVIDPSYEYPETLYQSNKSTELVTIPFTDNPHNLPMEIIHEWVKYRKGKKWPLSQIVWTRLNKELAKCQNPQDAFEQVVAAGWQGFTAEWITKNEPKRSFFDYDKNSLVDDKDIF